MTTEMLIFHVVGDRKKNDHNGEISRTADLGRKLKLCWKVQIFKFPMLSFFLRKAAYEACYGRPKRGDLRFGKSDQKMIKRGITTGIISGIRMFPNLLNSVN